MHFFMVEIIYIKWTEERSCHEMDRVEFRGACRKGMLNVGVY